MRAAACIDGKQQCLTALILNPGPVTSRLNRGITRVGKEQAGDVLSGHVCYHQSTAPLGASGHHHEEEGDVKSYHQVGKWTSAGLFAELRITLKFGRILSVCSLLSHFARLLQTVISPGLTAPCTFPPPYFKSTGNSSMPRL